MPVGTDVSGETEASVGVHAASVPQALIGLAFIGLPLQSWATHVPPAHSPLLMQTWTPPTSGSDMHDGWHDVAIGESDVTQQIPPPSQSAAEAHPESAPPSSRR